eukprot:m.248952 g.248952  ORF g.248952 m.248952 type:complete len:91 (-) comp54492_c0_seq16:47-319(-)
MRAETSLLSSKGSEGRHISNDWANINVETHPLLLKAQATQVVIGAGDILYVPSDWLHYPITLQETIQCNVRSGASFRGRLFTKHCGFYPY